MARAWAAALLAGLCGCASMRNLMMGESVDPSAPPAAPQWCAVSQNEPRGATVSWNAPLAAPATYRIVRSESADGPFETVGEISPRKVRFVDGGTPASTMKDSATYYYRIVAVTSKGVVSEPSETMKTVTAPPPEAPRALRVKAPSSRAVKAEWGASPSPGVSAYRLERAVAEGDGPYETVVTISATSFRDGGTPLSDLRDSTRYRYRVVAVNRVGSESVPSEVQEVTTMPPPAPVTRLAARSGEVHCVPLSWAPSRESDVVRYDVYRSRSAQGEFKYIVSLTGCWTTNYLDGGSNPGNLEDECTYFYRVRAVNDVTAKSADSVTVRATTRSVPPEVQGVHAVSDRPREVPLSWRPSADEVVVGYEIWRTEGDAGEWAQIGRVIGLRTTNYTDRGDARSAAGLGGLKDGQDYRYRIVAYNTANVRSSASQPDGARTKRCPQAPAEVKASTGMPRRVQIAWRANPEKDVSDYLVESSEQRADGFRKLGVVPAATGAPSVNETDLESGARRFYRVKANDADGLESEWSEVVEGRAKPLPDAPAGLKSEPARGGVRLTWDPPPQADVRKYGVWVRRFMRWELAATTERPERLFDAAVLTSPQTVAVTAIDADELESPRSGALELRLAAPAK